VLKENLTLETQNKNPKNAKNDCKIQKYFQASFLAFFA
jgi:hypothetical protein